MATPRIGARVDAERLQYELTRRGLSAAELAKRSGVTEVTISRLKRGQPTTSTTLAKLAAVLVQTPVIEGADLIMEPPRSGSGWAPPVQRS